jgi:hypothetical protein
MFNGADWCQHVRRAAGGAAGKEGVAMGKIRARLDELGIALPEPWTMPPGVDPAFDIVVVSRGQAWLAGHGPVDGSRMLMSGVVGEDLTVEQGIEAARLAGLSVLASLERELGDLDRVTRWLRAAVFVNSAKGLPGPGLTMVGDGFSALVKSVWGDAGGHARVAPGVHGLPFNLPLVVEATVEVD